MTGQAFRKLALSLPNAVEGEHMGHPDFRIRGKIFAALNSDEDRGMVKLSLEDQETTVAAAPGVFMPCNGAWGRMGATEVRLPDATGALVKLALTAAWRNIAEQPPPSRRSGNARSRLGRAPGARRKR
jgi:hypothetical protein